MQTWSRSTRCSSGSASSSEREIRVSAHASERAREGARTRGSACARQGARARRRARAPRSAHSTHRALDAHRARRTPRYGAVLEGPPHTGAGSAAHGDTHIGHGYTHGRAHDQSTTQARVAQSGDMGRRAGNQYEYDFVTPSSELVWLIRAGARSRPHFACSGEVRRTINPSQYRFAGSFAGGGADRSARERRTCAALYLARVHDSTSLSFQLPRTSTTLYNYI